MAPKPVVVSEQQLRALRLLEAGVAPADVARVLGVSRQRVNQLIHKLRAKGLLPKGEEEE